MSTLLPPATTLPTDEDVATALSSPLALSAYCRIRGVGPWHLWRAQRLALMNLVTGNNLVILKARQLGMTWTMMLYVLWYAMTTPEAQVLVVSRRDLEATGAVERLRYLHSSIPPWLRRTAPERGQPNIHHMRIGSGIVQSLPSGSGRSFTSGLLVMDEGAQWDQADERIAELLPTAADTGQAVICSTANGIGNQFWHLWAKPRKGWARLFAGALERPDRTRDWVDEQRTLLGPYGPQEYPLNPEEAFLSSGHGVFDASGISWQVTNCARAGAGYRISGAGAVPDQNGRWTLWESPKLGRRYLVCADSSGGGAGSDPSAVCVYDSDARSQVAAFWGRIPPHAFARELAAMGKIYNTAMLAPEANDHGKAVVAHLVDLGYPRIYAPERGYTSVGGTHSPGQPGWVMNRAAKHLAVGSLGSALSSRTVSIRDADALGEMALYGETAPGKFAAVSGHDDRVIAHAIACAVMDRGLLAGPVDNGMPESPYWTVHDRVGGY